MNKTLIIHNNNVSEIQLEQCDEKIRFISFDDTLNTLIQKKIDLIYIKDNLSSNYLEFYGLLLAYHIRLSTRIGDKRFIPIVILSDLDSCIINKITKIGRILFTKNIFIASNNKVSIEKYKSLTLSAMSEQEYDSGFLSLIEIEPPEDSTNHSIANEWAIYRWSEFLKVEDEAIVANNAKIENMLYFKYLLAKYPLSKETGLRFTPKSPNSEGKILYIDDDWNKGWQNIFVRYFSKNGKIELETVEEDYKDKSYDQVESFVVSYIKDQEPDVIILDMRLVEEDDKNKDEKDLSGIKLLSHIKKEINPGIQVVMLTASGKSSILDEANKHNILGYIKKEHPQDINIKTKESFDKLTSLINAGLDRKYLKKIWTIENDILTVLESNPFVRHVKVDEYDDALKLMKITVKSIYILLDREIPNYLQYAMLAIFKCLEIFKDIFIKEQNNVLTLIGSNMPIKQYSADSQGIYIPRSQDGSRYYSSTENRLHALLFEKLNIRDKKTHADISSIVEKRNKFIHPDRSGKVNEPYNYEIIEWFRTLENIISKL